MTKKISIKSEILLTKRDFLQSGNDKSFENVR